MRPCLSAPRAFFFGLALAALTGCSALQGWTQASTGHSPTAGASLSVPFGK